MKKILIIEDEEVDLYILTTSLKTCGYDIHSAKTGADGIQKALEITPDLIICDITMPGIDGFDVLKEIKLYPEISCIPFIFISANDELDQIRAGMDLGADDYLVKPISAEIILKCVEARLRKRQREIEYINIEKNLFRQRIATMLPHEFNTPLLGILGGLQLLSENYDMFSDDEKKELIEIAYTNTKRLHRMSRNYLTYARLEMSNGDRNLFTLLTSGETWNVKSLITETLSEEASNQQREYDFIYNSVESNPAISISEENLRTILSEIINNAFRYSKRTDKISINCSITDEKLYISISDPGRGMNEQQIEQIGAFVQFERMFYEQQGAGLGLVLSKKITEMHNGHFNIKSKLGEGTTVSISLPTVKTKP
jgi:two-component system, sensor histidine kinase and response regulator